ncbi:hypothetical protein [Actinomadura sp. WMMA1423]|uniref:hypothetical protein n=1 Tax=Actinomadura sp. WMMA1423 TaxID=2591108 RepID=UPI0011473349|nr:hypothetical protein [Actinomadura sp. WMMA1423]
MVTALDAKSQCDIVDGWFRAMTIPAHGEGRPLEELMAEFAAVNDTRAETVDLVSALLPGEAHDLHEAERAQSGGSRRNGASRHPVEARTIMRDGRGRVGGEGRGGS